MYSVRSSGTLSGNPVTVTRPPLDHCSGRIVTVGGLTFPSLGLVLMKVIVTGSAGERDLVDAVCAAAGQPRRVTGWAGTLELGELAALIAQAELLISNNSGPVHIASAVGTPVVDLYALTNPQHGPWNVPHRLLYHDVPCRFCYRSVCPEGHHQCLLGVPAQLVVDAACELLDEKDATAA